MSEILAGKRHLLRDLNRTLLLNIAREAGRLSHSDMTKATGLSPATVTSILKELKEENYLKALGPGKSKLGRKPVLMQFNYEARYVVSVAFFADKTQLAILDLNGKIKDQIEFETASSEGIEAIIKKFASNTQKLLSDNKIPMSKVLGVGTSFEGMIDSENGMVVFSTRTGWRNVPVRKLIEEQIGLSTFVESEGIAMALGEYRFGAGREYDHIVCVEVDSGIGCVELHNGNVFHGSHNMAGEIGHTPVMENELRCKCGKFGCLETVASGWSIIEKVRKRLEDGTKSIISGQVHSAITSVAIRAVFEAAHKGDEFALSVVNEAGRYLGMALAGIINYADPKVVIMTGCVTHESEGMLVDIVKKVSQEHILGDGLRTVEIKEGSLLDSAALIGNATLVYNEAFKGPVAY